MEWVETTGRTVGEALDLALDRLGVDEHDVEYEILVEPKAGLFGRFGGTEARIRARVKPLSREKPGERRRNRRERGRSNEPKKTAQKDGRAARTPTPPAATDPGPGTESRPASAKRRRNRSRGRSRTQPPATMEGTTVTTEEPTISPDEQAAVAVEFIRGIVDAFEAGASVTSRMEDEDVIVVDVTGPELGLLVGPRGATLTALEELVRTVLQRHTGGHGARIHVDVGGYRAKRREALAAFTTELVQRVLDTGRDQVLEPMPAADRKVVHDTVTGFEGVSTASEGEEPRRRVVIRRA
ncbi:MAG: RNA-binding cell elongation regulator Jag/EloR [Acidimicrobiia bacterium]